MYYKNPFFTFPGRLLFESLLLDFILAFTFFTSVCYAVLSKRFDHQRSAVGMSASIGAALSVGIIWWENRSGITIRSLGPIALVFAMILIAIIIYRAIKQTAGSWSGGGLAIGLFILFILLAGLDLPIDPEVINSLMVSALVIGFIAMLLHHKSSSHNYPFLHSVQPQISEIKDDQASMYRNRCLSNKITKGLKMLKNETDLLKDKPQYTDHIVYEIKRLLPEEGWLTQRMANLRKKAHQIKNGHVARLEETKDIARKLPLPAKKKLSKDIVNSYNNIIDIDKRIERLDAMIAHNESRIKELTKQAQQYAMNYDYKKLTEIVEQAEKLQEHNSKIFKIIDRTENKLSQIAQKVVNETKQE